MGWEYHNRSRDMQGHFEGWGQLPEQLHIRVTKTEGQRIRDAAWGAQMEISEWCRTILMRELERRPRRRPRA